MAEISGEIPNRVESNVQKRVFEIDSTPIEVNCVQVSPRNLTSLERTMVFLPGWSMDANGSAPKVVGNAFAEASGANTMIIDTVPQRTTNDSLYKEARAIARFLSESGVTNVTIAGHSEGGVKAVDLAVAIQKQREAGELDINVDGVILMESMGLLDQGNPLMFAGKFLKDGVVDAQIDTLNKVSRRREGFGRTEKRTIGMSLDVILGTLRDVVHSKFGYPKRLLSQIDEMKGMEPHLGEVQVPVILVNGKDDLVAKPEKVLPDYDKTDDREELLKQSLFPKAPYIRMVTGDRLATHGMPIYRAEQVAKTSLYLIDRFRRQPQAA